MAEYGPLVQYFVAQGVEVEVEPEEVGTKVEVRVVLRVVRVVKDRNVSSSFLRYAFV